LAMIVAAVVPAFHNVFGQLLRAPRGGAGRRGHLRRRLIDDIRDMSAPAKMAGEVLAASILYFLGVTMYQFKIPLAGFVVLSPSVIL